MTIGYNALVEKRIKEAEEELSSAFSLPDTPFLFPFLVTWLLDSVALFVD